MKGAGTARGRRESGVSRSRCPWAFAWVCAAFALAATAWWSRPGDAQVLQAEHVPTPIAARAAREYPHALVLGSGGPRGLAHIGVLQVLDEAGYRPDLIVGTSMGALIGALVSTGKSGREMEQRVLDPNPWNWVRDLTWSRHGWLRGEALDRILHRAGAPKRLEALPIAVVAVATRLPDGTRIAFQAGDVVAAVRASSASPGMLLPVRIDGQLYVDGDLVAPVPVATARELGARRIIAVDVSAFADTTPPIEEVSLDWVERDARRRLMIDREAADADMLIRVRMPYYVDLSRSGRAAAIEAGRAAARAALPELRRLGLVRPAPAP